MAKRDTVKLTKEQIKALNELRKSQGGLNLEQAKTLDNLREMLSQLTGLSKRQKNLFAWSSTRSTTRPRRRRPWARPPIGWSSRSCAPMAGVKRCRGWGAWPSTATASTRPSTGSWRHLWRPCPAPCAPRPGWPRPRQKQRWPCRAACRGGGGGTARRWALQTHSWLINNDEQ